jgi:hypothetical protein
MVPLRISRVYVRTFRERAQAKDEAVTQRTPVTKRRRAEALRREERDTENEGSKHSEEKSRSTQRRAQQGSRERGRSTPRSASQGSRERNRSTPKRGTEALRGEEPKHSAQGCRSAIQHHPLAHTRRARSHELLWCSRSSGHWVHRFVDSRFAFFVFVDSSIRRFAFSRFSLVRRCAFSSIRRFAIRVFRGGGRTRPQYSPPSPPPSPPSQVRGNYEESKRGGRGGELCGVGGKNGFRFFFFLRFSLFNVSLELHKVLPLSPLLRFLVVF